MKFTRIFSILWLGLFIASLSQTAFAQKYELNPYAGGYWPGSVGEFDMKTQTIWGLRGGVFLTDRIQVEGNFGYNNHFFLDDDARIGNTIDLNDVTIVTVREDLDPTNQVVTVTRLDPNQVTIVEQNPKTRGYLWEANFTYNFFSNSVGKFAPYLTLGLGGTTVTRSDEQDTEVIIAQPLTSVEFVAASAIVNQRMVEASLLIPPQFNDGSYFTINYGGGLKAYRLWGPVGLRGDFLGRSLPNFGGESLNGYQLTGGITLAWGER